MKKQKVILLIFAAIILIGGIMGVMKGLAPDTEWLSFRYLFSGDSTFEADHMPIYIRIYGILMGLLEIISASFIFSQRKRLLLFVIIMLMINMIGCMVAVFIGDVVAIVSLVTRTVPLYLVIKEYHSE